jgi:myo-inositol-1-phosphate synthase
MRAVRVGVVGVGNCAASLVQGVHYYREAAVEDRVPGLMHVKFGDYHVGDIQFVTAFDVDAKKVGLDLSEAIGASKNNAIKFAAGAPIVGDESRAKWVRRSRTVCWPSSSRTAE